MCHRRTRLLLSSRRPPFSATGTRPCCSGGRGVALFVNELTLLPILMPFAPAASTLERFTLAAAEVLHAHGVHSSFVEREVAEMIDWRLTPTQNRSVLGVMNEFAYLADAYRDRAHELDLDLVQLSHVSPRHRAARSTATTSAPTGLWRRSPDGSIPLDISAHAEAVRNRGGSYSPNSGPGVASIGDERHLVRDRSLAPSPAHADEPGESTTGGTLRELAQLGRLRPERDRRTHATVVLFSAE